MSENNEEVPDVSKFNEDSVPPEEKEIKQTHPGRPDLDYEETPVGPAPGVEYISKEELEKKEEQE